MINTLFLPELREMLRDEDHHGLREFCTAIHPAGTAEFMAGLNATEAWNVLKHTEPQTRGEIFHYFERPLQLEVIRSQPRAEMAELIGNLAADDRVDLLHEVEPEIVDEILSLMPADERRNILRLRAYPEGTAGAVMTTEVACLGENLSVAEALDELRRKAGQFETIYYLYVVDSANHLRGLVSARQLVSAMGRPDTPLRDLMESQLITVDVDEDQEEVAQKVARYDLLAIPVVDDQHRMLGIITYDDVIDVFRAEATEDAHRIGAVAPLRQDYLSTPLLTLGWKRGMWLSVLFGAALMTIIVLTEYQGVLQQWQWLILFIPLVISSGGNSGNQSATLIITGLSTDEIQVTDWFRVIWRELLVGLMLGTMLAIWSLLFVPLLAPEARQGWSTLVIPMTLVTVVTCGTLLGSILPLIFKRIGLDPALMSNPFVAGLIDILGIVIYINVAMAIIQLDAAH